MRLLCLDVGTKRIGIAVTDPLGWTAQPAVVLDRRGGVADMAAILKLCRDYDVERIIVGLPLDAQGERGLAARRIERFIAQLERRVAELPRGITIEAWDERYSTAEAEARLIGFDMSRAKRRRVIDKMAAVVILESYLREHAA